MAKRLAGLVIFRRANAQIEYLMLKPSKDEKAWSPPKGLLSKFEIKITNEVFFSSKCDSNEFRSC